MSREADDPIARRYFRQSLLTIGIAFFVMLFFFLAAFFLAVRGAERTVVPQIIDLELIEAMVMLQERELYPRLQVKYTGNPDDKGRVIDQDPESGLYVKAGRRITVTVSKGAVIDNVEDYVGKTLEEVRGRLTVLFSTYEPLLYIREPVTFVYNEAPAGVVLSQSPAAGTSLGEPMGLILIVSRGTSDSPIRLPDWTDWNIDGTLNSLASLPLTFQFVPDDAAPTGSAPRVTSQNPAPKTAVEPGRLVTLHYRPPAFVPEGSLYELLEYTLPNYPIPVLLEVIVREPGAEDRPLFSMPYLGGPISFPYVLPVGSGVFLMVNGVEVYRQDVLVQG